ncbi:quercetin 2,3-dioxygenase [Aureococcus anophagefferens]|nr:quercetin 2,3-dioxygenase [Aureococcus anophagefferens]
MTDEPPPPIVIADPALLALPPLADGEVVRDSGDRACVKPEAPCPVMFGAMHKLLGHKDGARPPFCAHPHSGVGVMTLLFQCAGGMRPWDNLNGPEAAPLLPGGVYHVDTGAGCLWYNAMAMDGASDAPLRPPSTRVRDPADVAVVAQDDGLRARVLAGAYRDAADGLRAAHPLVVLHVEVAKAGTLGPLPAGHDGFLWVLDGRLGAGDALVALGAPHRRPYAKYVGYGGGFVHRDAAGVEAAMAEYERDPATARALARRAPSTSHLDLVGGFQDNGGPMLEQPDGVVARFKNRGSSTARTAAPCFFEVLIDGACIVSRFDAVDGADVDAAAKGLAALLPLDALAGGGCGGDAACAQRAVRAGFEGARDACLARGRNRGGGAAAVATYARSFDGFAERRPVVWFDGRTVPAPDDSYDVVCFTYVLHHAAGATIKLLREARRVSKRYVVVLEDLQETAADAENAHAHEPLGAFRTREEWVDLFVLLGFSVADHGPCNAGGLAGFRHTMAFWILEKVQDAPPRRRRPARRRRVSELRRELAAT